VNTLLSMVAVVVAVLALFVLYGILTIVVRLTRDWNALRAVCPVPGYIDRLRTG
jgi:uncharacterized protein with PQ loop repeat